MLYGVDLHSFRGCWKPFSFEAPQLIATLALTQLPLATLALTTSCGLKQPHVALEVEFEVTASNSLGGKIEVRCLKQPQTAFEIEFDVTASNSLGS